MANVERLTKRVKNLEEWTEENEMTGGPQGVLDAFIFLLNSAKGAQQQTMQTGQELQQFKSMAFEFIEEQKLGDDWNEFVTEKTAVPEEKPKKVKPSKKNKKE
tara:strand:+ start:15 stop:323 length:309 start_codon:yes stop_codon:yes gene_type:complete